MALDERRRSQLFDRVVGALGEEAAVTMFELLPPPETELATRADLDQLEVRMDQRFTEVDQRFAQVDQRFAQVDQRFAQVDARFDQIDARFGQVDDRFDRLERRIDERANDLRNELVAVFRGELVTAVAGQTRAVIVATAGATVGIGGLAFTFAQLL